MSTQQFSYSSTQRQRFKGFTKRSSPKPYRFCSCIKTVLQSAVLGKKRKEKKRKEKKRKEKKRKEKKRKEKKEKKRKDSNYDQKIRKVDLSFKVHYIWNLVH